MQRESDGSAYHGLRCKCGSRATKRVEGRFLVRTCTKCHGTYYYRLHDGEFIAYPEDTALGLDEMRQGAL